MSNKMLIDASHPEETRVAVVRGNRIEEYDFESQEKKQLRGNIYLAKVTRVEPSLQAAFVDYGGNRHGFLAFSEIHPDYYQIPVADRLALLEAEAAEARAARDAEDDDNDDAVAENADDEEEAPVKKTRSKRGRRPKKAAEDSASPEVSDENKAEDVSTDEEVPQAPAESDLKASADENDEEEAEKKPKRRSTRRKKAPVAKKADDADEKASDDDTDQDTAPKAKTDSETEVEAKAEEKPKRRSTRRKKAPVKKADNTPDDISSDNKSDDGEGDDGDKPTTMAAIVETESISEDIPESPDGDDDNSDSVEAEETPKSASEEKPKRRSTRRKKAPVKAKKEETAETDSGDQENSDEPEKEETGKSTSEEDVSSETQDTETESEAPKKKKRAPRRSNRKKAETSPEETEESEGNDENGFEEIESVGQEDALEEVEAPRRLRRNYKIQEVIKRRQVLLVQVVKEERGNKGAALTTYLSLAGRYSVLMPNTARGGGISRKITNAADRKRLKAIANGLDVPNGMGVILRTAGASRTNAEIERDFDYLMRLWEQVRNLTLSSSAPCLVYEEGSLIKRSIRDLFEKDTNEVIVAGEDGYREAKDFMTMLMPSAASKVKLHRDKQSLFTKFGVETQLDKMVTPQVTLKSGGYLIIDQTEALVSVDVNSGRSTREHSIENTALQTNLEAAEEVARQLRLRDLAGLVVIDFIDMEEKRNNRAVEKKLKECLKNDRARIQVGRISHFGLLEMSRQRMRASVLESTMDVCSHCGGTGHVRSDSAIALHVFRAIEEHVSRHNRFDAIVKTTQSIALHILNHKRAALLELENRYGLAIIIEGSRDIKGQDFEIQKGEPASGEVKSNAVGYQNNSFEEDEASQDDTPSKYEHKNPRNQEENSEIDEENQSTTPSSEQDDDDDKPRKKRRRGKRGGRRRNNTENSDNQDNDDQTSNEHASATASEISQPENHKTEDDVVDRSKQADTSGAEDKSKADEAEEKPKHRSTTRRKAPITKKAEPDKAADQERSQPVEAREEPPRPKRRTTRRKKIEHASDDQTDEPATETLASEAEKSEGSNVEQSASSDNGDGASDKDNEKKKSWWNRGGSFF